MSATPSVTEPLRPDLCIWHGGCIDGFSAAWAVWKRFGDGVFFHPGVYGEAPPNVADKHVLLVDFSYKSAVLRPMIDAARSVTILDHHKTAEADLRPLLDQGLIYGEFDMTRSGAVLAWHWFHEGLPVPALLQHVQDRDLWKFELPDTREIHACLSSHPFIFEVWDNLVLQCESEIVCTVLVQQGAAINRKHKKDVNDLLGLTTRSMIIGGHHVLVANLPPGMSSDAAGELAQHGSFGATYYDGMLHRHFSLRSRGKDGADVSEIASRYGGGGHRNAAGFSVPIGWEGD